MIYFFSGSDTETVRKKAFAWVEAARRKEPQLIYTRLAADDISTASLAEVAGAGALFVKRLLVLLDDPLFSPAGTQSAPTREVFFENLDALARSDNAIIVLAPNLTPLLAKKISAKATKEYRYDHTRVKSIRGFNSALVNALAARDAQKLWLEVVRAFRAGDAPEMVHGLLHWKARDLMKKGSRVWTPAEARALSLKLIILLGDARRTGTDLALALERFALSLEVPKEKI